MGIGNGTGILRHRQREYSQKRTSLQSSLRPIEYRPRKGLGQNFNLPEREYWETAGGVVKCCHKISIQGYLVTFLQRHSIQVGAGRRTAAQFLPGAFPPQGKRGGYSLDLWVSCNCSYDSFHNYSLRSFVRISSAFVPVIPSCGVSLLTLLLLHSANCSLKTLPGESGASECCNDGAYPQSL